MFYFLIFLSMTITFTVIRISSLRHGYSKLTRVLMMFIPAATWVCIIWQMYTPFNFYVGLAFIVIIFEVALWISSRAEQRYLAVTAQ